jgi:ubiquinone/menaquinone biosynthesis C-methylase UbiE
MSGNLADFSGNIPQNYDSGMGPIIFAGYAADVAQRIASHAPSNVLETAAGTGVVTRALRDALPASTQLTATDLNVDMLAIARAKFRPNEQVAFQPADATALPFPDASFDAVICQFGVMFFPDKDRSYREVLRVLAPGGCYVFSVWDAHRYNPFGRIAHEVIGSFFPTDPPKFYEVPFSYHLIDPIKESLIAAGFDRIVISVLQRHQSVADFSAFARGVVFGNPVFDQIRQRGGATPDQIQEAVATAMRLEFGGEPGVMPIQAIVFEARKPGLPVQAVAT